MKEFEPINKAYNSLFKPDELSIGVVVPIENYDQGPVPNYAPPFRTSTTS